MARKLLPSPALPPRPACQPTAPPFLHIPERQHKAVMKANASRFQGLRFKSTTFDALKMRIIVSQEPLCKCGEERRAVPEKLCLPPKACWERVPDYKGLQRGDPPTG